MTHVCVITIAVLPNSCQLQALSRVACWLGNWVLQLINYTAFAYIRALSNLCIIGLCLVLSTQAIAQGLKQPPPLEFTLSESQLLPVTVVKPAIPFKVKQYNSPIELDFRISKKKLTSIVGASDVLEAARLDLAAQWHKDINLIRKFVDKDINKAYDRMTAEELKMKLQKSYDWLNMLNMRVTHEFTTDQFVTLRTQWYMNKNKENEVKVFQLPTALKREDNFWVTTDNDGGTHPISILINYKFTAPEDLEQRYDGEVIYKKLSDFVTVPPSAFTHHQLHNPD